ncbi:MAG: VRR-NUC domain-containing protein [Ruminococcus sp.]|nr:VRR-NUC domain-containing protein [Ruminococcus sp.]
MTESQEQIQLIQWCRTDPRLQYLFHIPNESVGGRGWLVRNRQMGVKAGVPDLFYPVPLGGYHGLFIEMKANKGRPSAVLKRWLKVLNDLGYKAVVCAGWEEARDVLIEYLKGGVNA